MGFYVDYNFSNLSYDKKSIKGHFSYIPCSYAPPNVKEYECDFSYNMKTKAIKIRNNTKAEKSKYDVPIDLLLRTLEKNGRLNESENIHIHFASNFIKA